MNLESKDIMEHNANYYFSLFWTYFDGCAEILPQPNVPDTYSMGVCKLELVECEKALYVYLKRPGLLIGKKGKIINDLEEHLGIKVNIVEVNPFLSETKLYSRREVINLMNNLMTSLLDSTKDDMNEWLDKNLPKN